MAVVQSKKCSNQSLKRGRSYLVDFILLPNIKQTSRDFVHEPNPNNSSRGEEHKRPESMSDGLYISLHFIPPHRVKCIMKHVISDIKKSVFSEAAAVCHLKLSCCSPPAGKGSSSISSDISSSTDHTPTKAPKNVATSEGKASGAH